MKTSKIDYRVKSVGVRDMNANTVLFRPFLPFIVSSVPGEASAIPLSERRLAFVSTWRIFWLQSIFVPLMSRPEV